MSVGRRWGSCEARRVVGSVSRGFFGRGNGLWNGHEGVSDASVSAVREEQLVDVAVNCIGPVVEGSTTEFLVANGYKRKVR
ncbi:hypothetical protein V6N12_059853 [Hibiscus sabdariffa]|uniref:Uncharacterized protein n=1 Tax=Hibiscus sabdariffa TaxID=183260 RepID=A0ABR2BCC6_9ROSI